MKILLIYTGGTISSIETDDGIKPKLSFRKLFKGIKIEKVIKPFGKYGIDSSEIGKKDIEKIVSIIIKSYKKYDGFLITHGTDTLSYTSSFLYYMLKNIKKPVVLTGSQFVFNAKNSDAPKNIEDSLRVLKSGNCGVWVVFNGKVIKGNEVVKIDTENLDAFVSNRQKEIEVDKFLRMKIENRKREKFCSKIKRKVAILNFTPTFDYEVEVKADVLVLIVYGIGGHKKRVFKEIGKFKGKIIAKSSSVYGKTDLNKYEVGRVAKQFGISSAGKLSLEAVVAKNSL